MASCELTMRSVAMGMDVKVNVIIPENRRHYGPEDKDKMYKVIYILHGAAEDNSTWMNSSNIYLYTRDLDCFVVCVSAYNSMYLDTEFGLKMQTYLTKELPIKMKNIFPQMSTRREDTFIMGESMGSIGTWYTTLNHPEMFAKAAPLSAGPFSISGNLRLAKKTWDGTVVDGNYFRELAKQVNDSDGPKVEYFTMSGTEDGAYASTREAEEFIKSECPNIHIQAEYWHGKHDFFFWNVAIPKALQFFGFQLDPERVAMI